MHVNTGIVMHGCWLEGQVPTGQGVRMITRRAVLSGALALPVVLASGRRAEAAPLPEGLDMWFVDQVNHMAPDRGGRTSLFVAMNPDVFDAVFVPIWDKAPDGWFVSAGWNRWTNTLEAVGPVFDCYVPVLHEVFAQKTFHSVHFSIDFRDEWWAISDRQGRVIRLTKNFVTVIK